ncbi:hypothetical protein SAMN05421805_1376 [Saccharopolyspora antimicrobica]|uniref:Uncharacterized protein n=1 Tax=Saccharopolyspora antimicrobica TaxID=455193 RepID=A0A1I5M5Q1_9PSEU|nr:hypothetical protein ATL45_0311 [Saccharopolyspora antimicrobica]SFP04968.1 hypothetical protein SAMN05421805_1376 [Saccharopolyspora antimicrobica]
MRARSASRSRPSDLAVTETGVITRGGLAIGWDEIAEVLVVRDARITSWAGPREGRAPGHQRSVLKRR